MQIDWMMFALIIWIVFSTIQGMWETWCENRYIDEPEEDGE